MRAHPAGKARPAGGRGRSGHTLIELQLSLAMTTVLMTAMVASLAITSRAMDYGSTPAGQAVLAAGVLEEINADLAMAMAFQERTDRAVTFSVPDRDGDGDQEVIRYAWTGAGTRQLVRQVNGGRSVVLAADVQDFPLAYRMKTVQPASP